MHPAMMYWWKSRQRAAERCGEWAGWGPETVGREWPRFTSGEHFGDFGAGAFGVRRPLRFLAFKLDLSDAQIAELAKILGDLKTERAQAEVDRRRTVAAFADAVAGEAFDDARAAEGAGLRVGSAERLRDAVVRALRRIHAALDPRQRERLAYLIRTGALTL